MTLIFASGGGRLGNQFVNILHLLAITKEYKLKIYKLSDYIINNNTKFCFILPLFKIDLNHNNWIVVTEKQSFISEIILKVYFRILSFILPAIFHILPFFKSYKYLPHIKRDKYILAEKIDLSSNIDLLVKESIKKPVVFSGWGLKNWPLVIKHRTEIVDYLVKSINSNIKTYPLINTKFIIVHQRSGDFKNSEILKPLIFIDSIWIKSILALSKSLKINNVVFFSDSEVNKSIIKTLEMNGINIFLPEMNSQDNFFELIYLYSKESKAILCNSSSLLLFMSFLFHKNVYTPSIEKEYLITSTSEIHLTYPLNLNWF